MKAGWTEVALGDVALIDRQSISADSVEDGTFYVGLENISIGGLWNDVATVDAGQLKSNKFRFSPDHVLFGKLRPNLAKIAAPDFDGICSTDILPILPNQALDRRYLLQWLRTPKMVGHASRLASGANLPRISPKAVQKIPVPLPPLEEQRRIAAILDAADALRAKRRQAIAKLDSLTQAIFIDMFGDPAANEFGYPAIRLGSVAEKFSDGPFGSNLKSVHYTESGIRVIRLQNIGVGSFVDDDAAYVSEEHFAKLAKHECLPGDVLVGTMGDPNLRACVQPAWLAKSLNKADCVQIRVDPSIATAGWLCALLNCNSTEQMAKSLVRGQTRARISMGRLRELIVPVPPVRDQEKLDDALSITRDRQRELATSRHHLDTLFESLQQRAFRGEL